MTIAGSPAQQYITVTDPVSGVVSAVPAPQQSSEFVGEGITPPAPQLAGQFAQPVQSIQAPAVLAPQGAPTGQVFTREEVFAQMEAVRAEEKQKLYGHIEQMKSQVESLTQEQQARKDAEAAAEAAKLEAQRVEEEAQMSARQLAETVRQESQQAIAGLQNELETERALRQKEAQLIELEAYTRSLLSQYGDKVLPELWDLITGNTPAEIEASFQEMINRTEAVMGSVQQQLVGAQLPGQVPAPLPLNEMRGVAPTGAAPVGPLEQEQALNQFTPQAIRDLSMNEYRANRERLMQAASSSYYQG